VNYLNDPHYDVDEAQLDHFDQSAAKRQRYQLWKERLNQVELQIEKDEAAPDPDPAGRPNPDKKLGLHRVPDRTINGRPGCVISLLGSPRDASNAPIAVRNAKRAITDGFLADMDHAIMIEERCFGDCFETEDQKEAMTAFVEKRKGVEFKNR
jgi:enoyl-CoA hydratase/carnithine racemase